jgi:uroporphyrinogen decarboxylase
MNLRENHLAALRLQPCQRTPRWELGFWSGTIQRWYDEGLPGSEQALRAQESHGSWVSSGGIGVGLNGEHGREHDVSRFFGLDRGVACIDINYNTCPVYPSEVLDETDEFIIRRDGFGIVSRVHKPELGMPEWIDYPVHNRQEWERFKAERYDPGLAPRLPSNWDALLALYRVRDYPLALGGGATGYFGSVRQILGLERTLTTLCDDPAWMHDMFDSLADFYVTLYDQVLTQIKPDLGVHWEDMCYVAGPLISPRMFREFMLNPYRKLSGLLRDHGVDLLMVDTDGDCRRLIPLFMEGGVTALYPFEVQSHMDVAEIRRQYPGLALQGGIDKKALAAGKDAIDQELERRVPAMLANGYIPHVDHATPPDVSFENFCYYRRKLDAMLDEFDARRGVAQ